VCGTGVRRHPLRLPARSGGLRRAVPTPTASPRTSGVVVGEPPYAARRPAGQGAVGNGSRTTTFVRGDNRGAGRRAGMRRGRGPYVAARSPVARWYSIPSTDLRSCSAAGPQRAEVRPRRDLPVGPGLLGLCGERSAPYAGRRAHAQHSVSCCGCGKSGPSQRRGGGHQRCVGGVDVADNGAGLPPPVEPGQDASSSRRRAPSQRQHPVVSTRCRSGTMNSTVEHDGATPTAVSRAAAGQIQLNSSSWRTAAHAHGDRDCHERVVDPHQVDPEEHRHQHGRQRGPVAATGEVYEQGAHTMRSRCRRPGTVHAALLAELVAADEGEELASTAQYSAGPTGRPRDDGERAGDATWMVHARAAASSRCRAGRAPRVEASAALTGIEPGNSR